MIKEERLNKLIEEKATIYEAKYGNINPVYLGNEIRFINYKYGVISFKPRFEERYKCHKYIKNLFETEEEAKAYLEFGNVKRTDKLPYYNYDEKNVIVYIFYTPLKYGGKQYEFRMFKGGNITIWNCDNMHSAFNKPATKENYYEACKLAKELFLGEIQV